MSNVVRRRIRILAGVMTAALMTSGALAQEVETHAQNRVITRLSGDVYQVRDDGQHTVFVVTAEGIILSDPLSLATAAWLKEELATRFPGKPVRYVLHTHHHFDRAEGASVFDATAELVGHQNFNRELAQARHVVPPFLAALDRDRNGRFDRAELAGAPLAAVILAKDRNGDGATTPDELYKRVTNVETVFKSRRIITLGGKDVELIHPGDAHARDMTVLYFPSERLVFAVDTPSVTAAPFTFGGFRPGDIVRWLDAVSVVDFDVLVLGDGTMSTRAQLAALRSYLHDLVEGVASGYESGLTAEELQASSLLDAYTGPAFAERRSHIADVYRNLELIKADISLAGMTNYIIRNDVYCRSFTSCSTGGAVPVGSAGLSVTIRRYAVVGELTMGAQSWSSRASQFYDEEFALRESRGALLFGYGRPAGHFSYRVLGGMSMVSADRRGTDRVKQSLPPFGGRHPIAERTSRLAVTAGVDLVIGRRLGIVLPVRINYALQAPSEKWPSRVDVQAGLGVKMRVLRWVQ